MIFKYAEVADSYFALLENEIYYLNFLHVSKSIETLNVNNRKLSSWLQSY